MADVDAMIADLMVDLDGDGRPDIKRDPHTGGLMIWRRDQNRWVPQITETDRRVGDVVAEFSGAPQIGRAIQAGREAYNDPSIPNVGNAAVQTALATLSPRAILGAAGAAYGAAGMADMFGTSAGAVDRGALEQRLRSMPRAQVIALQRSLGIPADGVVGSQTISRAYDMEARREAEAKANAGRQQELDLARIRAEADAKAQAETARVQAEVNARSGAEAATRDKTAAAKNQLMQELTAARTPPEDQSVTGALYNKLGVATPMVAALGAGAATRLAEPLIGYATKNPTFNALMNKYINPGLAGAEMYSTMSMVPVAAQANRADPTNPEYRAWQNYMMRLPAEATDEISRAREASANIPQMDPAVTAAQERLGDYVERAKLMGLGFLAGVPGYQIAAGAQAMPRLAAEGLGAIPGNVVAGYRRGMNRANAEAGAVSRPAGGAASPASGNTNPPPPPPPPQIYDQSVHGPASRAYLNEMLTFGSPTAQRLGAAPDVRPVMVNDLLTRYQSQGLPAVDPAFLWSRVNQTLDELARVEALLGPTNAAVTAPRVRNAMIDMIQGRPGMLAVPVAAGLGLSAIDSRGYQ